MSQPLALPSSEVDSAERHAPLYHVVLLDDDEHTYDYVIEMLERLFLFSGKKPSGTPLRWTPRGAPS